MQRVLSIPSVPINSLELLPAKAPVKGDSQQHGIISFPTCYDYGQCQLGSCASQASPWQFHPGMFSQLQLYASGFFLPLLLSPSSLLELAWRSISILLLYLDIDIIFYFTRSGGKNNLLVTLLNILLMQPATFHTIFHNPF